MKSLDGRVTEKNHGGFAMTYSAIVFTENSNSFRAMISSSTRVKGHGKTYANDAIKK